MARKAKETNNTFKEFEFSGNEFKYSGRLYPNSQKETTKCTITPCSICFNGVITVKGCKLIQTDKNAWIEFPQYKKDDEYVSYFFIESEFSKSELSELVKAMEAAIE